MTENTAFETVTLRDLVLGDTFSIKINGQYAWGDKVIQGTLVMRGKTGTKRDVGIRLESGETVLRLIHPGHPVRRYV